MIASIYLSSFTLAPVCTCTLLAVGTRRKVRTPVVVGIGFFVGWYYYNHLIVSSSMAAIATQCRQSYDSSLSSWGRSIHHS